MLGDRIRRLSDPLADDELVIRYRHTPGARTTRVALVWGQLPLDNPPADYARDWSGALSVDRGAMLVHATVGLEDAPDGLLPRTEVDALALQSHTQPHVDALLLDIIAPDPAAGRRGLDGSPAGDAHSDHRSRPARLEAERLRLASDSGTGRWTSVPRSRLRRERRA